MRLKITTPNRTFDFTARENSTVIIVGTRPVDDICIDDDPKVSGPHVRLEKSGDTWSFTDQFSDAGTIHNGAKGYSGDLKAGDTLQLGDTQLQVLDIAVAAAVPLARDIVTPAASSVFESRKEEARAPHVAAEFSRRADEPVAPASAFVRRIMLRLVQQFQAETGIDVTTDAAAIQRVGEAAQKAVRELETERTTTVNLPFLSADASGPKHLEVEIARRHLHETGAEKPPEQSAVMQIGTAKPVKGNPLKALVATMVILVVAGGSIWFAMEESADIENDVQEMLEQARLADDEKKRTQELKAQREEEIRAILSGLRENSDASPQQQLDELIALETESQEGGASFSYEFQRTRTELERRVYISVERRYGDLAGQMFQLQETRQFRRSKELVDGLVTWLAASPHNDRAIRVMELDETLERWQSSNTIGNERLLADQLLLVAEALSRDDYGAAAEALKPVVDGAILPVDQVSALEAEGADLQAKAERQAAGELPAARLEFDRKRDRLPASPENTLLKAGDSTARSRLSPIRTRIMDEMHDGLWNRREISVWGLTGEVNVNKLTSRVPLKFTRAVGEGTVTFTAEQQFSNFAPAIQLALFEVMERPTTEDLMAMLVFAFDTGLNEDAGRIAAKVRAAAPDKLADLDAILAAKWNVPVPEGGFPERDGRVVRE